ncbi:oxygen-insensitive NADPH nitroreductase [Paenibacillus methanolicus]|uniref:FMN reductase (NADPH) n=1 Tax=Paenibacillus methanolicus TaxID=582686 RepID=A0A5S5BZX2_9BACL|nr:oxygen-insensitive NADPH nitroreductase [Paenibacillus methanolicus]TYP72741.1 FMN reductase (NADPH) [Paenibacillus methanolicus]
MHAHPIIDALKGHRSIRKFKPDPIPDEHIRAIVEAAQAASTSSNIQAYTVIGVRDPERKQALSVLAGNQRYVAECPLMLVWCADLHRLELVMEMHNGQLHQNTETLLLGTVDVSLAAQNAAVAAESLGYGIVYIGGIRNRPDDVAELLRLPANVYPVFGMCVGTSDQEPDLRPRLPMGAIYHEETYAEDETLLGAIKAYDETLQAYYAERSGGARASNWSVETASRMQADKLRGHMKGHLNRQGFRLE